MSWQATSGASDGHAWRQPVELSSRHWENRFFKSVLSRNVAFGMEWTRHQLAPAMPGQKIVDRAVAGRVPDGLFVGRLEIMDVQHFASPGGLGKTPQQGLFLSLTLANLGGARESQFCRVKEYGGEFCHCLGLAVTVKKLTRPYFSRQTSKRGKSRGAQGGL